MRWWETKHWWTTRMWQLASVSIAAQILTFPISIYYFHQFPTYFILSGVAAVFLATFILTGGLLLFFVDGIPYLGDFVGHVYSLLVESLVKVIKLIQSLPLNKLEEIYFSKHTVLLLYVCIGTIMFLMSIKPNGYKGVFFKKTKHKRTARYILLSCIVLLALNSALYTKRVKENYEMITYDISKGSVIDFFVGSSVYSIRSEKVEVGDIEFSCTPYRIFKGVKNTFDLDAIHDSKFKSKWFINNDEIVFKNKHIFLVDRFIKKEGMPCTSDILMVINSTDLLPSDILETHKTSIVVLDRSLTYVVRNKWIKACKKLHIPFHDIRSDGVFSI